MEWVQTIVTIGATIITIIITISIVATRVITKFIQIEMDLRRLTEEIAQFKNGQEANLNTLKGDVDKNQEILNNLIDILGRRTS